MTKEEMETLFETITDFDGFGLVITDEDLLKESIGLTEPEDGDDN